MIFRLLTTAALVSTLLFAAPASAQDRLSRTELTTAVSQLEGRAGELEAKNNQLQIQNADLSLKLRELQAANEQITGRLETLQFQLGQSNDNLDRMVADDREIGLRLAELDDKIAELEGQLENRIPIIRQSDLDNANSAAAGSATPQRPVVQSGTAITSITSRSGSTDSSAANSAATSDTPDEGTLGTIPASALPGESGPLFADAKARLLRFDYAGAERSFKAFLTSFGDDPQAGEAQYWLGEVLYQQKSYAESGEAYQTMIRKFPTDVRAPDALVKLGRSLRLVGELETACAVLGTLPSRYPDASPVTRNLANVERSRSDCDS